MKFNWTRVLGLAVVVVALGFVGVPPVDEALADRTTATTIWHSDRISLTAVNQVIRTTTMNQRVCVGWLVENLDADDTIYLNVNNYKNPEPVAVAGSYTDQVVVGPGATREIHVHDIAQIQGVADGDGADLYWQAICHMN